MLRQTVSAFNKKIIIITLFKRNIGIIAYLTNDSLVLVFLLCDTYNLYVIDVVVFFINLNSVIEK